MNLSVEKCTDEVGALLIPLPMNTAVSQTKPSVHKPVADHIYDAPVVW
jgi:hypothetical protein